MVVITAADADLSKVEGIGAVEIGTVIQGPEKVRLPF